MPSPYHPNLVQHVGQWLVGQRDHLFWCCDQEEAAGFKPQLYNCHLAQL